MTDLATPSILDVDRIRLLQRFDVNRMLAEIKAFNLQTFLYYDVLPLRAPAHFVNPELAPPPPAENYADGSWTDWLDTSLLKSSHYLNSVLDLFRENSRVTLVRLLRLAPGGVIDEHTDPTLGLHVPDSVVRLTIPIQTNEGVAFYLNDEIVPMQAGECWYLRLSDPHRVVNSGTSERISMSIDIVPNAWLRSQLVLPTA